MSSVIHPRYHPRVPSDLDSRVFAITRPERALWRYYILASLLFGALLRGGLFVDIFTEHVSKDLVVVLQGIIILFVAAEALFRGSFARVGRRV